MASEKWRPFCIGLNVLISGTVLSSVQIWIIVLINAYLVIIEIGNMKLSPFHFFLVFSCQFQPVNEEIQWLHKWLGSKLQYLQY